MTIGVLALQGAFVEHEQRLTELGAQAVQLRCKEDLQQALDGLILPGGESTAMGKLLRELDMLEPIREKIRTGMPVLGTCAGLLLLAETIENDTRTHLATMSITANRNAYGRQLGSFYTEQRFADGKIIPMTFIRAPYIRSVGEGVTVLAAVDNRIVAARQKNQLVTAFHPELNDDSTVHAYFLDMISEYKTAKR
ncbi:MAG: pyridoxal 5'-phosphate synthase glutaminase subunit PdxT [Eubacteriales bacterium]|nr:pyridoxal 5'-phosphate synthase glutaminase subunit PdxT [Eubacteriales bacterium]